MAVWFGEQLREVVLSAKCCYGPSPSVCWSFYKTGNYISRKWWDKWTGRVKLCIPGKQAKHTRLYSHRLQASRWRMQGYILTDSRQAGEACKAIFSPTPAFKVRTLDLTLGSQLWRTLFLHPQHSSVGFPRRRTQRATHSQWTQMNLYTIFQTWKWLTPSQ